MTETVENLVAKLSGAKHQRRPRNSLRLPLNWRGLRAAYDAAVDDDDRELAQSLMWEMQARVKCMILAKRATDRVSRGTCDSFALLDVLETGLRAARRAPRKARAERDCSAEVAELVKNRSDIRPFTAPWSLREAFDLLVEFRVGRTDVIGRAFGINRRRASAYLSMARKRRKLAVTK